MLLVSSILSSSQLGEVGRVQVVVENEPFSNDVTGDLQLWVRILRFSMDFRPQIEFPRRRCFGWALYLFS
jgi:hypothetical protein